jgi:hypothetical protein
MRRVLGLWGLGALALFGVAVLLLAARAPTHEPGVTLENFRQLRLEMTREQVDGILGSPGTFTPGGMYRWEQREKDASLVIHLAIGNSAGELGRRMAKREAKAF